MNTNITTLDQAEEYLRATGIVRQTKSMLEVVEGKMLLDVCGFSYTDRSITTRLNEQIKKHGLIEDEDYKKVCVTNYRDTKTQRGGHNKLAYIFDLNAANHILLAAMTTQGKQARQQAINLANKPVNLATACTALPDLNDPIAVLKAFTASLEHKKELETKLEIAAPKADFYDDVVEADQLYDMNEAAGLLNFSGRNTFMKRLRDSGVLMESNIPYRTYIDRGYFEVKVNRLGYSSTKVTPKGLTWLHKNYKPKSTMIDISELQF